VKGVKEREVLFDRVSEKEVEKEGKEKRCNQKSGFLLSKKVPFASSYFEMK
jgi:hypothetical protein